MTIFGDYAYFYDTLYEDKDYKKECQFLEKIFKKYASGEVRTILDLGCGTDGHGLILAEKGYRIIDNSKPIIKHCIPASRCTK